MQPFGGEHMPTDQLMQRRQSGGAGTDMIRQARHVDIDAIGGQ